ncbi:hypothetical protein CO051_05650 [Candidatus Roizmanbacteria bacterium CG_4_9_14_0_2_um_filter_39_13]|uniref:DUF11 domain-containing protein n=1 Tax=Candidatus Roizmanbacteria bacterium CG_4_9_14_0_2_um_filter_39_13 TaxID=1974839 RepID=A0A2M8EX36_9BACT|nr:MAG: hypothetical protein CO051_05650 [Candidatus Roizmanbacteria bacterium CG_4_9_14_0_2_um_filter_39_13]
MYKGFSPTGGLTNQYILMKNVFIAIILSLVSILSASSVRADYGQYGQYDGGASSYSIIVDKMVMTGNQTKGGQAVYVDNLSPSDPRFAPGAQVTFQVKVKNTSDITLSNIQIKDILPNWVDAVEGPGEYDANTRTISWTYPELKSGEGKLEKITVQIKPQDQLPADQGLMCMNNKATAKTDNVYDEDTSQFCLEKQVTMTTKGGQPVTTTPDAGAPLLAFGALNMLGLGAGLWMKKKA